VRHDSPNVNEEAFANTLQTRGNKEGDGDEDEDVDMGVEEGDEVKRE
jgi:hypothetical protein